MRGVYFSCYHVLLMLLYSATSYCPGRTITCILIIFFLTGLRGYQNPIALYAQSALTVVATSLGSCHLRSPSSPSEFLTLLHPLIGCSWLRFPTEKTSSSRLSSGVKIQKLNGLEKDLGSLRVNQDNA